MLESAEGELSLLEAMRRVLLCILEAVEGGLWAQFRGFEILDTYNLSPTPLSAKQLPDSYKYFSPQCFHVPIQFGRLQLPFFLRDFPSQSPGNVRYSWMVTLCTTQDANRI